MSVVAGIAELIVAMTTDWSRGIVKLIPPAVHGMIDAVFVLALILVPFVFGFSGDDDTATAFFVILGVGGVLLVLATRFVPDAGTRRGGVPPADRRDDEQPRRPRELEREPRDRRSRSAREL